MPNQERVILDTHIWIWLLEKPDNLSSVVVAKITHAAKQRQLLIAAISLWEVSLLAEKKRISLKVDTFNWLNRALSHAGTVLCPLTAEIAASSYTLPGSFHGDPADRMIVATARNENAILITRDEEILQYAKAGHVYAVLA